MQNIGLMGYYFFSLLFSLRTLLAGSSTWQQLQGQSKHDKMQSRAIAGGWAVCANSDPNWKCEAAIHTSTNTSGRDDNLSLKVPVGEKNNAVQYGILSLGPNIPVQRSRIATEQQRRRSTWRKLLRLLLQL